MELFAQIRRDARVEEMGIRALARKYKVGRDTVRQALARAEPPKRKTPVRESPKLGPFKPAIDEMLRTDLDAARQKWIRDADTDAERQKREESSFLAVYDDAGRVVGFHALRASFASLLAASGCHPKAAPELHAAFGHHAQGGQVHAHGARRARLGARQAAGSVAVGCADRSGDAHR